MDIVHLAPSVHKLALPTKRTAWDSNSERHLATFVHPNARLIWQGTRIGANLVGCQVARYETEARVPETQAHRQPALHKHSHNKTQRWIDANLLNKIKNQKYKTGGRYHANAIYSDGHHIDE